MTPPGDERWPYLSPVRPGWRWVGGARGELRRVLTGPRPASRAAEDPVRAVLDTLEELERLLHAMQHDTLLLVTEAYYRGASWRAIAGRLHRTKQTVHQRYQARVHARRTHELLREDLREAHRRAQETLRHRPGLADRSELAESAALLRGWPELAGDPPPISGGGPG